MKKWDIKELREEVAKLGGVVQENTNIFLRNLEMIEQIKQDGKKEAEECVGVIVGGFCTEHGEVDLDHRIPKKPKEEQKSDWVATSRSLVDPVYPAFRIEKIDRLHDLVYQANGESEAIKILMDGRDLNDLRELLKEQEPKEELQAAEERQYGEGEECESCDLNRKVGVGKCTTHATPKQGIKDSPDYNPVISELIEAVNGLEKAQTYLASVLGEVEDKIATHGL